MQYFLEYSPTQKCFHVDTLDNIIKINLSLFKKGFFNDYIIIGSGSYEEVSKQMNYLEAEFGRRTRPRISRKI